MPQRDHAISIVASGHTAFGRLQDYNLEDLITEATRQALDDGGVGADEIDRIFLGHFNSGMVTDGFPASLVLQSDPGFRFTPATRCENACASGAAALFAGMEAIRAGDAELVLVVGAEKMTSNSTAEVTQALAGAGYQNDAGEAGLSFPGVFALAAQDYRARYGDPLPAMARIAAKNHGNALTNPLAHMRREMSFDQCNTVSEKNPIIADPLRLTDCSLITDGAAAVILASPQRAAQFKYRAAVRAAAQTNDFLPLSRHDLVSFEGPRRAIESAYGQAGIQVHDLDFAEVHDCFTIAELLAYEALGLAPAGQGQKAIESGMVYADGALPVNLSGGLKAKGHPVGATGVSMHAMAFRQLTGRPIGQARPDAELGLIFNMGGAAVANYVTILEAM